jgi:hypothetical protein
MQQDQRRAVAWAFGVVDGYVACLESFLNKSGDVRFSRLGFSH